MTQQEIKDSLNLPFANYVKNGDVICSNGYTIVDSQYVDEKNCIAITHAINNTYGKGINPESVPDMFNQLTTVHFYLRGMGDNKMADIIQEILNKASL